jgi:hypothetical protein
MLILVGLMDGGLIVLYRYLQGYETCMNYNGIYAMTEDCPMLPETTEQIAIKVFIFTFTLIMAFITFISVRADNKRFKRDF